MNQVVNGRANPADLIVVDLKERFDEQAAAPAFDRLYDDPEFGHMFAVLHRRLNKHFDDINGRATEDVKQAETRLVTRSV